MKIQSYINGLLTGLIIGVLFAPSAGSETRRKFEQSVKEGYPKKEGSDELSELTSEEKAIIRKELLI
jgi:gas vesicle protein